MSTCELELEVLQPEAITIAVTENNVTQVINNTPPEEIVLAIGGARIDFGTLTPAPTAFRSAFVDETTSYYGYAAVASSGGAAVWRVIKATYVAGVLEIKFADQGQFTQIWDNRASLIYA